MKKVFVIIFAIIIIVTTFVACDDQEQLDFKLYMDEIAWVNYGGSEEFYFGALNRDKLSISSVKHLPIYKFDSLLELEQFKSNYADEFQFGQTYDEFQSFLDITKKFDEEYFNTYSLFIIYVSANSGSYRYAIDEVISQDESYTVYVKQANNPEQVTDDMAGWFIMLTAQKSAIKDCTDFDAQMTN